MLPAEGYIYTHLKIYEDVALITSTLMYVCVLYMQFKINYIPFKMKEKGRREPEKKNRRKSLRGCFV